MLNKSSAVRLWIKKSLKNTGKFLQDFSDRISYYAVAVEKQEGDWIVCRTPNAVWRLNQNHSIDNDIIRQGNFEYQSIELLRRIVRPGMHAADVGANFGYYTVHLSQMVGPAGVVYAFEPSVTFRARLVEHVQLNRCDNVIINGFGLSDKEESLELLESDDSATLHWWYGNQKEKHKSIIHLKTLDSYVDHNHLSRLDVMKVDIDGHEPNFIRGAQATLKRFRPVILMEFMQLALKLNNNEDVEGLAAQLKNLGYDLYSEKTGKPYTQRHDFVVETMNAAFSVNVLCIPTEKTPAL